MTEIVDLDNDQDLILSNSRVKKIIKDHPIILDLIEMFRKRINDFNVETYIISTYNYKLPNFNDAKHDVDFFIKNDDLVHDKWSINLTIGKDFKLIMHEELNFAKVIKWDPIDYCEQSDWFQDLNLLIAEESDYDDGFEEDYDRVTRDRLKQSDLFYCVYSILHPELLILNSKLKHQMEKILEEVKKNFDDLIYKSLKEQNVLPHGKSRLPISYIERSRLEDEVESLHKS